MNIIDKAKNFIFPPKAVPFTAENYADFNSVIDIGCANGFLLKHFYAAGKEVSGIELSADALKFLPPEIRSRVQIGDFSEASGHFDLVTCVEVAEHVPPKISAALVEHVCRLAKSAVFFTAAPPGQPGHGHINCRPHQDWIDLFAARGWRLDSAATRAIKSEISDIKEAKWLIENVLVFLPSSS